MTFLRPKVVRSGSGIDEYHLKTELKLPERQTDGDRTGQLKYDINKLYTVVSIAILTYTRREQYTPSLKILLNKGVFSLILVLLYFYV